jgi:hypothetical protein
LNALLVAIPINDTFSADVASTVLHTSVIAIIHLQGIISFRHVSSLVIAQNNLTVSRHIEEMNIAAQLI